MAFMQKPTGLDPEDTAEAVATVALEEDGDAEEENLQYSGMASFVDEQFRKAKDDRQTKEERWLMTYRNYSGIYGPEMQFTDTEKSKAFIKITKTKVLAAFAQIVDVLSAGSKFPISIEPRNHPANVADAVNCDPEALSDEKVQEKTSSDYKVPRAIARPEITKDLGVYKERLQPVEDILELGAGITQSSITFEPA